LCINNLYNNKLHNSNKLDISKSKIYNFEKKYPFKFVSFKKSKIYYLENNIYYDIYKDNLNNVNNFYNTNKIINKNKNKPKTKLNNKNKNKNKSNQLYVENNLFKEYLYYNDLTAEHIFPQSFIKIYPKAKFDMHNIFLTNSKLNSYRSNYKFVDESEYLIKKNNGYYFKNNEFIVYNNYTNYRNNSLKLFIPIHSSRGLIARSVAYMKYTYEDLVLENVIDKNILIKWNNIYPPSEIEKKQNLLIKEIQGNENIFITNYELVNNYF
tara:strand:+ start:1068 stop:1868 length:801 start_codon:yes stop_codon:yes gene_type:complete